MRKARVPRMTAYQATLKVFGKIFTSEGTSVAEAITNLQVGRVKGMSILTLSKGGKSESKVLPNVATSRLFSAHGIIQAIQLKNVVARFGL